MTNPYQQCTRCIMDTTDPEIKFDKNGVCNHCREFDEVTSKRWFPNSEGQKKLEALIAQLKKEGEGKEYDCILGLSGGLDSSYLALIMKDYGLRPLVVHVNAGWNTPEAEKNIQTVVKYCGFELHTKIIDWDEMKDLQLAYLKAGVANQDVPQDHAFFTELYKFAIENKVKYVISGSNIATEAVLPQSWQHDAMDGINIKDIYKKNGGGKLKKYRTISFFEYYFLYPYFYGMKVVKPLNYMEYSKEIALKRLQAIGYIPYERKHGESLFTRFFQNYYLPNKFGVDKRIAHLSSLVLTNIISRDVALAMLKEPLYTELDLVEDKKKIAMKLSISIDLLDSFIQGKKAKHNDFQTWNKIHFVAKKMKTILRIK